MLSLQRLSCVYQILKQFALKNSFLFNQSDSTWFLLKMSGYEDEENIKLIDKFIKDFSEFGKKSYFAKKHKLYQTNLSSHIRKKKFSPKIHKLIQEFYSLSNEEKTNFLSDFKPQNSTFEVHPGPIPEIKNSLLEIKEGVLGIKPEVLEQLNSDEIDEITFNLERIKIFSESTEKLEELKEKFKDEVLKKNIEFEFSKKKEYQKLSKNLKYLMIKRNL
jgi:hypothetical protein